MTQVKLSRKELYDLVWSEPMTTISKKYKISDVGLRKICLKMLVPIPEKGYWRKIRTGKSVTAPALPGDRMVTLLLRKEGDISNPSVIIKKEIEANLDLPIVVPAKLIDPDPLIIDARESLKDKNPYSPSKGIIACVWDELDISVSPGNVDRALLFMDTLIKLLRARGHGILIEEYTTYAIVEGQKLKMSFKEKLKKVPKNDRWQSIEYLPAGKLSFSFKVGLHFIDRSEWKDGKFPLETRLSKILAQMELKGREEKEERLRWQKHKEEQEERERLKRELEKRKQKELSDFKGLLSDAERWRQADVLRKYIERMETIAIANNTISEDLNNWLNWARKKADWYDPFIDSEDEVLNIIDKISLTLTKSQ